ncbi:unnamed protein product [Ceratitis capitata]|uniref:(Mediterranean fruit fly) hypothetical protein n=1 Tax=Ceratitis capitata TaxID=7213 RepID=A0A811UKH8_CERCA|nr:unnamed protein product [Ceratitis capitata]
MPGSSTYNLRWQDLSKNAVGGQHNRMSAIIASLNALTNTVAELKSVTENSQRDIERLRTNIWLDVHLSAQPHLIEATRQSSSVSSAEGPGQSTVLAASELVTKLPLTDVPLSSEVGDPITLNHFLVGWELNPNAVDRKICMRKQWRIARNLKDHIWKQWTRHYLLQLLLRQK